MFIQRNFTETNVTTSINGEELDGGAVIVAKEVEDREWCFAVLQGDTPRVIFPEDCVKLSRKENYDTKVVITVDRKPQESIEITIDFGNFVRANVFYTFLKRLGSLQVD